MIKRIFCILLLVFLLPSCANILQEKMNSEEPPNTNVVLTEPESADEPIGAEAISIVFRGEKITAPGSYVNVLDLYAPVLDDLYLYGAVTHRYSALQYDGKGTTEIMRECESVQSEIRQRGYLPYPGDGSGTAGYAMIDLDGDNNPELLLLNDPFRYYYRKQTLEICAIFAIRN